MGDVTTKLTSVMFGPKDVASFDRCVWGLRLCSFKRIAGEAADLVERVEVRDFTHGTDRGTKKEFIPGAKGEFHANSTTQTVSLAPRKINS
ncbi:hypothetical protein VT84_38700 [Gemmata sp. SH-PL17]|uniref:hypothetical protein n=1 Tax=Gemmata sp. SH-PL17 TaxID=1630693 RepID=UPI0004B14E3D|nr:hypothetical protein [Gemmata sp. SH-PL17]AMV30387.1 hypothetical protein VT84_38700 [Gemmata sp. SH-PL17]